MAALMAREMAGQKAAAKAVEKDPSLVDQWVERKAGRKAAMKAAEKDPSLAGRWVASKAV